MRDCLYTVHKKGYPSQDEAWLLFILISSSFHSWDAHLLGKFLIITVVTSFQGGSWANFVNASTHRATLALQSLLVMSLFFNALMPLAATFAESGYVETLKDLQHLSSPGVRLAHFVTPCWDSAPGPPQYRKYICFHFPFFNLFERICVFFDVCSQIFRNLEIFILGRDSPVLPSLAGHIWLGQGLAVQRHGWAPESTCHGPVGHPITCLKTRWLWQGTRWHCTHVWLKLPGPSDNQNASRWECQEPW